MAAVLQNAPSHSSNRCLFCDTEINWSGKVEPFIITDGDGDSSSEAVVDQLAPMFVVRELLGVSLSELEPFFKTAGSPSTWGVTWCDSCTSHVTIAFGIYSEIGRLKKSIRLIKQGIVKSIQGSMQVSVEDSTHSIKHATHEASISPYDLERPPLPFEDVCGSVYADNFDFDDVLKPEADDVGLIPPTATLDHAGGEEVKVEEGVSGRQRACKCHIIPKGDKEKETTSDKDKASQPRRRGRPRKTNVPTLSKSQPCKLCLPTVPTRTALELGDCEPHPVEAKESDIMSEYDIQKTEKNAPKFQASTKNVNSDLKSEDKVPEKVLTERVQCLKCRSRYCSEIQMQNHFNAEHSVSLEENHVKCDQCHLAFSETKDLNVHKKFNHSDGVFTCEKCARIFNSQKAVNKHKGRAYRPYYCKICSTKCCDAGAVKQHVIQHHVDAHRQEQLRKTELKEVKKMTKVKPQKMCEKCGKVLTTYVGYAKHMEWHNRPEHSKPKPQPRLQCTVCEFHFSGNARLKIHQCRQHAKELNLTPVSCPKCLKLFPDSKVLSAHVQWVHETEKNYVCEQCGKRYSGLNLLTRHMKKHGDPKFKCKTCSKMFHTNRDLKDHANKHVSYEMRPYWCNICRKRFTCGTKLFIHRKIHEEGYPYECNICKRTFKLKNYLYCHMRYWHNKTITTKGKPVKLGKHDT